MDRTEVIKVLESLGGGVNPATGVRLFDDAFQNGDVVRALFTAATLLKGTDTPAKPGRAAKRPTLAAAGSPWSTEEDLRLTREFDDGMTVAQIALQHGRSSGATRAAW